MENVNKRRPIFLSALSKLEPGLQEINSREIRLKKTGRSLKKKTRIHFKSDGFSAVAVVDAKAP